MTRQLQATKNPALLKNKMFRHLTSRLRPIFHVKFLCHCVYIRVSLIFLSSSQVPQVYADVQVGSRTPHSCIKVHSSLTNQWLHYRDCEGIPGSGWCTRNPWRSRVVTKYSRRIWYILLLRVFSSSRLVIVAANREYQNRQYSDHNSHFLFPLQWG